MFLIFFTSEFNTQITSWMGKYTFYSNRIWHVGFVYQISTFSRDLFVLNDIWSFSVALTLQCPFVGPSVGWRGSLCWRWMKLGLVVGHDVRGLSTNFYHFPVVGLLIMPIFVWGTPQTKNFVWALTLRRKISSGVFKRQKARNLGERVRQLFFESFGRSVSLWMGGFLSAWYF